MSELTVLLVDPSAVSRNLLRDQLQEQFNVRVAPTLDIARSRVRELKLLGAVVGVMDATEEELAFVRWLSHQGVAVFGVARDARGTQRLRSVGIGPVGLAPSPRDGAQLIQLTEHVTQWLRGLAPKVAPRSEPQPPRERLPERADADSQKPRIEAATGDMVICIGVSTGGPEALHELLSGFPSHSPPIVIVQHMLAEFTAPLARRLSDASRLKVREARGGELLEVGHALIAPGDRHLRLRRQGLHVVTDVFDAPLVERHRPSVNVLFESAARVLGRCALGLIMTGMGDDGARGLLAMRQAGATTVAQDAAGCTVFGMPARAIALGAAEHVVPLPELAQRVIELCRLKGFQARG